MNFMPDREQIAHLQQRGRIPGNGYSGNEPYKPHPYATKPEDSAAAKLIWGAVIGFLLTVLINLSK